MYGPLRAAMATTRTMRRLSPEPVPSEDLARILWCATRAPSADNRQPLRFVVLAGSGRSDEAKALLGEAFRRGLAAKLGDRPRTGVAAALQHLADRFEQVPVVVLVCLRPEGLPSELVEGASAYPACQNLLLAARSLGYGAVLSLCHLTVEADLRRVLGIPDDQRIAATIPLGRPLGRFGPVRRRPLADVVFDGAWGAPAPWAQDGVDPEEDPVIHAHELDAIRDVIGRSCQLADSGRLEEWADLFVDGATLRVGDDAYVGRDAMIGRVAGRRAGHDAVKHLTANTVVEFDAGGAQATASSDLLIVRREAGGPFEILAAGRFADTLRRTRDGWRLAARTVELA